MDWPLLTNLNYLTAPINNYFNLFYRLNQSKNRIVNPNFMFLYERIRALCKELNISQARLAEGLGLRQPQLNGYLSKKSEKNLWEHLPRILALYPQVSRAWLFHNEGEMFAAGQTPGLQPPPGHDADEITRLKAHLDELRLAYIELSQEYMRLLRQDLKKQAGGGKNDSRRDTPARLAEEPGGYAGDGAGILQESGSYYSFEDK